MAYSTPVMNEYNTMHAYVEVFVKLFMYFIRGNAMV
jgi:hypothetical protein